LFIVKFGSTAIIQQEKGRIFQSMETYVQRLAIYNRGAGIPIDMLMDATLVIQFGQRLFVWEGSRFYIREMEPQQDGRVVFYPQLSGLTDTRSFFVLKILFPALLDQYQNGPSNIGGSGLLAGITEPSGYCLWRDSRLRAASTSSALRSSNGMSSMT